MGEEFFERLEAPGLEQHHARRLEHLGSMATLTPHVASSLDGLRGDFQEPLLDYHLRLFLPSGDGQKFLHA